MNLKPEELVKALRCCAEGECRGCQMYADRQRCQERTLTYAADQIERDQKEIEALRAALEKATEMADALNKKCDLITKKLEQYRALVPSLVIPKENNHDA